MSVILYTQEELDQFITRASCCASNQAYKALKAAQIKNYNTCEQNKHTYLEMALCALTRYTPVGTVLSEAVTPHPAVEACASIDLSVLMTDATFLGVTLTVNGNDLAPGFPSSYYASVDAFAADLLAAANAAIIAGPYDYTVTYYSTSDPTPSLQGKFVICSSIAGDAYNGIPVNFQVHTDYFYEFADYLTTETDPVSADPQKQMGVVPIYMGYNPQDDLIIGSGNQSHAVGLFLDNAQNGIMAAWDALGAKAPLAVAYSDAIGRIYIGDGSGLGSVRIFDSNYNEMNTEGQAGLGYLGTGGALAGTCFKMCVTSNNYLYTCGRDINFVRKWDVSTLVGQNSAFMQSWAVTAPFSIKENPAVAGEVWLIGDYTIAAPITNKLWKISAGGVLSEYDLTYTDVNFKPRDIEFVYNSATALYELWIVGLNTVNAAADRLQIISDTSTLVVTPGANMLTSVPIGNNITSNGIRRHSTNDYVYITSLGPGAADDTCLIVHPVSKSVLQTTNILAQANQDPWSVIERTSDGKMFVGCYGDDTPGGHGQSAMMVIDYISQNIDLSDAFSGGEDEVTDDIPAVIVEEDDGTNCLTQAEVYNIIENVKKICGCCCEFEDEILQRDI